MRFESRELNCFCHRRLTFWIGGLRRHLAEGECRDEANDTLWNFEGDDYKIWIAFSFGSG
jgi:hypothetical protein